MGQEWIGSGWLQLLARLSLGALLAAAAASKWRAWDEFEHSLAPLRLAEGPAGRTLARLVPWIEMGLGALLLLGLQVGLAGFATAALMVGFAALLAAARGG